jgi:dihydroorotate dehydrogenase
MFKRDLYFSKPMMNTAGMLGYAPNFRDSLPWEEFGVFVTNPISLHPRLPTGKPDLIDYPGGLLLHTGLPNPGFKTVLSKYANAWTRTELSVMVHLMADRPEETVTMVHALEGFENIIAVELGFAPQLADDIIILAVELCQGEIPLVVNLPAELVLNLGPRVANAGAAAVSLAPPRGTLPGKEGALVTGRLYGPSLFPKSLEAVHSAARLGLPIIAAGGIYSVEDSNAMLLAGALAFQYDTVLWKNKFEINHPEVRDKKTSP